jgi:hypothetical protein
MTETIINFTIRIAPAAILIGIIFALGFMIIRKINNIDKILNEINRRHHDRNRLSNLYGKTPKTTHY